MGTETFLRVGIDGTGSVTGARVVTRSLDDIYNKAVLTDRQIDTLNKSFSNLGSNQSGVKTIQRNLSDVQSSASSFGKMLDSIEDRLIRVGVSTAVFATIGGVIGGINNVMRETLSYLGQIETSTLGIASSFMVSGKFIDETTGKALTGQRALSASMAMTTDVIEQLKVANMQTIATLDQLIVAYQVTLPVAMSKGFNKQQVMDFTLAMVQAAGAIGLSFDQMAEETRSMLTGNITRNSRIAQVLGLRPEDIAQYKGDANGLFTFLQGRLEGFTIAGEASQKTWAGLWSNMKDISKQGSSFAFDGMFEGIKADLTTLMKSIVTINTETKKIKWDEGFVSGAKELGKNITSLYQSFIEGAKWVYEHAESIKNVILIYTAYKLSLGLTAIATRLTTVASSEDIAINAAKRVSIMGLIDAESARLTQNKIATALQVEKTAAVVQEMQQEVLRTEVLSAGLAVDSKVAASKLAGVAATERAAIAQRVAVSAFVAGQIQTAEIAAMTATHRTALLNNFLVDIDREMIALQTKGIVTKADYAFEKDLRDQQFRTLSRLSVATREQIIAETELADIRVAGSTALAVEVANEERATLARQAAVNLSAKTGIQRLAAKEASIAANIALAASESAATGAIIANTEATAAATLTSRALTVAKSALSSVITALGGPIGAIITLLTLATTAWMLFGDKSKKAIDDADTGITNTNKKLETQITLLKEQQRLEDARKGFSETNNAASLLSDEQSKDYRISKMRSDELKKTMETADAKYQAGLKVAYDAEIGRQETLLRGAVKLQELNKQKFTPNPSTDTPDSDYTSKELARVHAYNLEQKTKFRKEQAAINAAWDGLQLSNTAIALKQEQQLLDSMHSLALGSETWYAKESYRISDEKNKADVAFAKSKLTENQNNLALATADLNKKTNTPEEHNKFTEETNRLKAEGLNLQKALNIVTADATILDFKRLETIKQIRDSQLSNALSLASQLHSQAGNTVASVEYSQAVERESQAYKQLKTEGGSAFAIKEKLMKLDRLKAEQDQENNLKALNDKNALDEAQLKADQLKNGKGFGFGAIDAQMEAEKLAITQKYEWERKALEDKKALIQSASTVEIDSISTTKDLQLAAIDEVHQKQMSAITAEIEARSGPNKKAELARVAEAESAYQSKSAAETVKFTQSANKARLDSARNTTAILGSLDTALRLTFAKESEEKTGIERKGNNDKLSMASNYTNLAGSLFTSLADVQDTTSRKGFESAKAFNIAAAVMSTAAAIMNALATVQPFPAALGAAAMAGAMGVIQIAKIASTSFGGGGSVSAPSGSFASGGAGGGAAVATGSQLSTTPKSISEQQTSRQLDAIAVKIGNAALAMGRTADSLATISDMMKTGSGNNLAIGAPSKWNNVGTATNGVNYAGNMADGAKIGAMAMPFIPILGGLIGAGLGAVVSLGQSMFGSGKWTTEGQGIQMQLKDGEIDAQSYTQQKKKGGWFKSDKNRTIIGEVSDQYIDELNKFFGSITNQLRIGATALSLGGGVMDDAIKNATIDLGRIATAGRSTEDIAKDITAAFTTMSNKIITEAIPDIADFAINSAETATDTYYRLAGSLMNVTAQFSLVGKTVTMTGIKGAEMAYQLEQLFGGADKMKKAMDDYNAVMFTEPQLAVMKAAYASTRVTVAFMEMGLQMPKTNAEFNELRNTITDPALFTALTQIGPTFAEITKQADLVTQSTQDYTVRILALTPTMATASKLLRLQLDQTKEMKDATEAGLDIGKLRIAQELEYKDAILQNRKSAYKEFVDANKSLNEIRENVILKGLQKIVDTQTKMATELSSRLNKVLDVKISALTTRNSLLTGDKSVLSPEAKYETEKIAYLSGNVDYKIKNAESFLATSKAFNASGSAYQSDFAMVTAQLGSIGDLPDIASQTLTANQLQITRLEEIRDKLNPMTDQSKYTALLNGNMADLNLALSDWQTTSGKVLAAQAEIDAINNLRETTALAESIADAVKRLADAIANPDYQAAISSSLPQFASGGITNGPSIAGEGYYREAVIPLPDGRTVPVTVNGSADNRETVAELKEQNRLLRALLNVSQAGLTRVANATEKTAESTSGTESKIRLTAAK